MDKPRILTIDDDPNLRKTLSDILSAKGYQTLAAKDGAEGLDLLKRYSVDVALIDLGLPDIPGIDLLAAVKASCPSTEAIILTGNATLDSAIEAMNKGAFSYLQKPYDINQLVLHIKHAIEKQRTEKALLESENKFRDLSEKSLVGIYLVQEDILSYVNPKLAGIFGYTADELTDKKGPVDLVVPEDWPSVKENILKKLSGESESGHCTFRGVSKEGEVVYLEVYGSRTLYRGRPAVVGTVLDITERKRLEDEREKLITQLQDALSKVKTLSGMLPICSFCKRIRNDGGYWHQIEAYISEHSDAEFSHGLCPECENKNYEELEKLKNERT
jgi:PAS domain S-box-containing protein